MCGEKDQAINIHKVWHHLNFSCNFHERMVSQSAFLAQDVTPSFKTSCLPWKRHSKHHPHNCIFTEHLHWNAKATLITPRCTQFIYSWWSTLLYKKLVSSSSLLIPNKQISPSPGFCSRGAAPVPNGSPGTPWSCSQIHPNNMTWSSGNKISSGQPTPPS